MTTVSSLWLMILIESLAVTTLATVVLLVLKFVKQQRDRGAATRLVNRIKEDGARRREETVKVMQKMFGFDEDQAKKIAIRIGREERVFYQGVVNFYLRRDAILFENLNIDYESTVDLYRKLKPPGQGSKSSDAVAGQVDESDEVSRLKIENKRLSEEVSVTMHTMSRMMDEYSSMFAGGADGSEKDQVPQQPKGNKAGGEGSTTVEAKPELDEGGDAGSESGDEEEVQEEAVNLVDGMDDLSDLDPNDGNDLQPDDKSENPGETLG